MKKQIAFLFLMTFAFSLLVGCSTVSDVETSNITTTEETTTTTTTEATTTTTTEETTKPITYKTYYLSNIKFKAPDSWFYEDYGDEKYLSPDESSNEEIFMAFASRETERVNISDDEFEMLLDLLVESYTGVSTSAARINSRDIYKKGDFYIGRVDAKAFIDTDYTHTVFHILFDNVTGTMYLFAFYSPESISEENMEIFNTITDSIELR